MRPPRIIVLILFLASSFFLVGRAVTSIARNGLSFLRTTAPDANEGRQSGWRLAYYNTPFSLFPPTAAISLTDDNSTSFAARPAAFGPKLAIKGLSGQLWVGKGIYEETSDVDGELGCSDLPGWGDPDGIEDVHLSYHEISLSRSVASNQVVDPARRSGRYNDIDLTNESKSKTRQSGGGESTHTVLESDVWQSNNDAGLSSDFNAPTPRNNGPLVTTERQEIDGKVVLLMRGGCGFLEKVMWAQRRGATAVIVGDNRKGGPLVQMFAHGDGVDEVNIPSVFTARTTAQLLSSLAQSTPLSDHQGIVTHSLSKGAQSEMAPKLGEYDQINSHEIISRPSDRFTNIKRAFGFLFRGRRSSSGTSVVERRDWPSDLFMWKRQTRHLSDNDQELADGHSDWIIMDDWSDEKDRAIRHKLSQKSGKRSILDSELESEQHKEHDVDSNPPVSETIVALPGQSEPLRASDGLPKPARPGQHSEIKIPEEGRGLADKSEEHSIHQKDGSSRRQSLGTLGLGAHEGLWVTITPTNSASPFFDTLLVLVISPLVTLTVVYTLLIIRARIRRRRWRAPKSVVDRLPVRTYQTVATTPGPSSRQPSPSSMSPTTPLLQQISHETNQQSRSNLLIPQMSGLASPTPSVRSPRSLSRHGHQRGKIGQDGVSLEWKKQMGRQVECVVCLEEYVHGVSRVMSLPCGHEFHVDCITPWLTTRRRTCPICKGDVVRSVTQSASSSARYESLQDYERGRDDPETSNQDSPRSSSDIEQGMTSDGASYNVRTPGHWDGLLRLWSHTTHTPLSSTPTHVENND